MKVFKIAIVGCGGVSRTHLTGYVAHPERVEVVALCDRDQQALEERSREFGVGAVYQTLEGLLQEVDFEVAVICTPTHVRESVIEEIAKDDELPFAGSYTYAVRPSHRLNPTYGKEKDRSGGAWSRTAAYEIAGDGDD